MAGDPADEWLRGLHDASEDLSHSLRVRLAGGALVEVGACAEDMTLIGNDYHTDSVVCLSCIDSFEQLSEQSSAEGVAVVSVGQRQSRDPTGRVCRDLHSAECTSRSCSIADTSERSGAVGC